MTCSSLGDDLFENGSEDFELIVTDGFNRVSVRVHRMVLKACSDFFNNHLGSHYQFYYIWTVPEGQIAAAIRLVKFFYTRDINDLSDDLATTKKLCADIGSHKIFNFINTLPN